MRKEIVSGKFYPSNKGELLSTIKACITSKLGPGSPKNKTKEVLGIISPHAGYMFSGPCQAHGFKELGESNSPDVFILLGLSHNGFDTCLSQEDFSTPIGILKNDLELTNELKKTIPINEESHKYEHSIEVQLPFLKYFYPGAKICPIIVSPDTDCKGTASHIFGAIEKTKKKVKIITSSDFSHIGPAYGFIPFTDDFKNNHYDLDNNAIKHILNLSPSSFLEYTEKTGATICGRYPIAVCLELTKMLGAKKAFLLKYYTSGDISGDYSNSVGYASIKIE